MSFQQHDDLVAWGEARSLATVILKPMRARVLGRTVGLLFGRNAPEPEHGIGGPRPRKAPSIAEAERTGCLILAAEDNRTNRLVLGKQLTRLGYAFEMAENGEAAWQALQAGRHGLLLTDCFMPLLDGYDLASRIRAAEGEGQYLGGDPGQRHLPIIALTANALHGEIKKCKAAGMDHYLRKPVAVDDLGLTLAKWLPEIEAEPKPEPEVAPEAQTLPTHAAVDFAALAEILGDDDPAGLREILDFFVEGFAENLQALAEAIAAEDRLAVRNTAHGAKGEARNAGATLLGDILMELEDKAMGDTAFAQLQALAEQAEQAFAAVREVCDQLNKGAI